jgi:hypothetical protein
MKFIKQMKPFHKIFATCLAILTIASIIAEVASHHGGHHWWSSVPLFWIWFGAIGCFVITIFAKKVLGPIIYKKEDYYNE